MPPVTNCASYIDIEARFVTVKGIIPLCVKSVSVQELNLIEPGIARLQAKPK